MNSDQLERLVVVEQEIKNLKDTNEAILDELKAINVSINKYKGFMGGVVFIISGLWGLFILFKDQIFGVFGR